MKTRDAVRSTRRVLLSRFGAILPVYLTGLGARLVAQTVLVVGLVAIYVHLLGTGRIESLADAIGETDLEAVASGANEADAARLGEAIAALFTPTTVAVLAGSVLLGLLAYLVARSFAGAAQVHTAAAALREGRPVSAGVAGAERDGRTFLALAVVRAVCLSIPTVVLVALYYLLGGGGLAVPLLFALSLLLWIPATFAIYLVFLFARQAIVIDGVGVRAGIRRSAAFVRSNPARVAGYVVVVLTTVGVIGVGAGILQLLGVTQLIAVAVVFVVLPAVGTWKTALYLDAPTAEPADERGTVRGAFVRGIRELGGFVGARPVLFTASLLLFGAGIGGGWVAVEPFTIDALDRSVTENVFGAVPIDTFVMLTVNNWLVAITTAYGGLAFGVPAAANLLFNGTIVGAVLGLAPRPEAAAALVAPHGIVEIPALAISGALGLHLGGGAWSFVRGNVTADELATELVRTYYASLGLLPVFVVAAFIEAFLTWWVASVLL